MKSAQLSQYFTGAAFKRLRAVEVDELRSNQHEINGTVEMKRVLGSERRKYAAKFVYLSEEDEDAISLGGTVTWYDAREAHATRSEWRLYFPQTAVYDRAEEDDLFVVARHPDDDLIVIVAGYGSTADNQLRLLFGFGDEPRHQFAIRDIEHDDDLRLGFAARVVLDLIGLEIKETDEDCLEEMLERFEGTFPTTSQFSAYARNTLPDVSCIDDPDVAIVAWYDREELLFRTLERHLVWNRITAGFETVDEYVELALSILNRRKSRVGHALENHLQKIFNDHNIRHLRTQSTENRAKPDFLFPGIAQYRNLDFPAIGLSMLGVKRTCKDRWRQVLVEAKRVEVKHLFTFEPGISENQTVEMKTRKVRLVLPSELHSTYKASQQPSLMNLAEFISLMRQRQVLG